MGGGNWVALINLTYNLNYTGHYYYYNITINKAIPTAVTPLANSNNANLSITFPNTINMSFNETNQTSVILKIGNTEVTKSVTYIWGGGEWTMEWNQSNNQNYSQLLQYLNLSIQRATGEVATYLGGARSNQTKSNATLNYNLSAYNISHEGITTLRFNGSVINSGTWWVSNLTNLSIYVPNVIYNLTASIPQTQNYTTDTEVWFLNITVPSAAVTTTTAAKKCRYKSLGYYNLKLPAVWEVNCL